MELQTKKFAYTVSNVDNFLRKRHTATLSFLIGILLFLLPFAELKCGSMKLADNTGIGIVLGTDWKVVMADGVDDLMKKANSSVKKEKNNLLKGGGVNIFAIVSLAAASLGLLFAFSNQKHRPMASMSAGILAAIMLIGVMIQYKIALNSAMGKAGNDLNDMNMGSLVKITFTWWYFLSLLSFGSAAFFSYRHHIIEMEDAIGKAVDFEFQEKE